MRPAKLFSAAITLHLVLTGAAGAQEVQSKATVNIWRPAKAEPTDERVKSLNLAPGFRIDKFAVNMGNARMMAVADDGSVYVTRTDEGEVVRLKDADGDGRAEQRETVLSMKWVHGITIHGGRLYLAGVKDVVCCEILSDGRLGPPTTVINDLPDGGQHPRRTMAFGPDGEFYISIGSTCNACIEANPESATIVTVPGGLIAGAARPGGSPIPASRREVYAKGLRNTIGFGWQPRTGQLWGVDQGIDDQGDEECHEELNMIVKGKNYGWPHVYEDGKFNGSTPLPHDKTKEAVIAENTAPVMGYTPHASPIEAVFIGDAHKAGGAIPAPERDRDGQSRARAWPESMRDDMLIAFHGSWNRRPPSGYELVRVRFSEGRPVEFQPFLTGFLINGGKEHFGRPAGLAWAADGSLLMSDDTCGVIYRIWRAEGPAENGERPGPRMGGG